MGDPAGVGLEIALRAWLRRTPRTPTHVLLADCDALRRTAVRLGLAASVAEVGALEEAHDVFDNALPVLHTPLLVPEEPGLPDVRNADAIVGSIERAVTLTRAGRASAVVTLPIAKAMLYAAGFQHPGHTEFIAALCQGAPFSRPRGPVMMLASGELRVALATIHAPLSHVPALLNAASLERTVRVVLDALKRDFAIPAPRVALAGLNPHAGEMGALGREEIEIINPVAALLRSEGHDVSDARPADMLFHADARAHWDGAVAMYHDQGLIPVKTLDPWGATNITLGLPIVRTSPDHGTGFDIAGRGLAHPGSYEAALRAAAAMAFQRTHA